MLRQASALSRSGARALSTATMPATPPIALFGSAGRYASALYTAAYKKGELLKVETDLQTMSGLMASSDAIKGFMENPAIPRSKKMEGVTSMLAAADACDSTKNVFSTLAENARLPETMKVISMFDSLMTAARGEVTAKVVVTAEPSAKELAEIKSTVKSYLSEGQKDAEITISVNPGLIQGMTIEIGDKFIDMSVATQLKKLQTLLSGI